MVYSTFQIRSPEEGRMKQVDNMKWKKIIIKDKFQMENGTVHNIQRRRSGRSIAGHPTAAHPFQFAGIFVRSSENRLVFPVPVCDAVHDAVHAYAHELV